MGRVTAMPTLRMTRVSSSCGLLKLSWSTSNWPSARASGVRPRQHEPLDCLGHAIRFNAGHALNYYNVQPVARLAGVRELYIGHAIVSRAVFVGLREAVREMKRLMREAAARPEEGTR